MAGFLPNVPEAVVAMLASASLGAVWSSCSPDFGVEGVLDRFGAGCDAVELWNEPNNLSDWDWRLDPNARRGQSQR